MSSDTEDRSPADALAVLRVNRDTIPWPQRVELVDALRERLTGQALSLDVAALLDLLGGDPKPEVRQAVANLLPHLPDGDFARLRPSLEQDVNAFVRRSVERAVTKRAHATRTADNVRFGIDQITEQLRSIEQRHGQPAARQAWRLCERYTELLVGSMVHDLRSILTHLRTGITALIGENEVAAGRSLPRTQRRAKDDIDFLERTVRDMEQFTDPLTFQRQPEPLSELARAAVEIAAESVRSSGEVDPDAVAIDMQIPERITVRVARHLIVTALSNVIKNSFEAFAARAEGAPPAGITLSATEDGAWAELAVHDNGRGFAQEEANTLLLSTPGRRNKSKRNSTGYGLPNAMRKIAAHGGTIRIESAEGAGTTVHVRLPADTAGGTP